MLKVPFAAKISSNGQPYWLPFDEQVQELETSLVTIPRLSPLVFESVSFFNKASYPLLPGAMHVQRNGTYMGSQRLSYTASGAPLELSLGAEGEIRMTRSPITISKKSDSILDPKQYIQRANKVVLVNTSEKVKTVEVRENIPVSKNKDITVRIQKQTTTGYTFDEKQGFLTWKVELEPGATKTLELHFYVRLPDNWKTGE